MAIELIDTVRPKNNQPFPIVLSEDVKGGLQYAENYDVMLSIPMSRRSIGMLCYVNYDQFYRLEEDLETWYPIGKLTNEEYYSIEEVSNPRVGQIVFIGEDENQQYLYFWDGIEWRDFNIIKEAYNYSVLTEEERENIQEELLTGAFCFVEESGYMYFYNGTEWMKLNISVDMDMSMYAKLTDLETKSDVGHIHDYSELTSLPEIPSLEGYATEEYVKNSIVQAKLEEEDIDLSGYTTQSQFQEGLATKADEVHIHSYTELTDVPTIPTLEGYATEEYVMNEIDAEIIFDFDMNTISSLGGISAGENLNGLTIKEIISKLLFPYVAPAVSASLIHTPSGSVFEMGQVVTVERITGTVTKKSEFITKVQFWDGNTVLETITNGVGGSGSHSHLLDTPIQITSNTNNTRFRFSATDTTGKTYYANTKSFTFYYPYYLGTITEDKVLNNATITSLDKKIQGRATTTNSFTTNNERMVIAYPKSYGVLSKILDANNFDVTGTFTQNEVLVTGLDGTTQSYYVYVNNASTVTNFKMTFYY